MMDIKSIQFFVDIARILIYKIQNNDEPQLETFEMLKIVLNEIERIKTHIEMKEASIEEIKKLYEFMNYDMNLK